MPRVPFRVALLTAALCLAAPAARANYVFTNFADNGGGFASFAGGPAINDLGELRFEAFLDTNVNGIYSGPNPATDVIADDTTGAYFSFGTPSMNNSGTTVFLALLDAPVITDAGLFTGPNPATDTVADSLGSYSGFPSYRINDAGDVYFVTNTTGGPQIGTGIYSGPDIVADLVLDISGPYSLISNVWLNDVGDFVFTADLDAGGWGVFTGPDPVADAVVTNAGPHNVFGSPTMNDAGQFAWNGFTDSGIAGIFTGPDPTTDFIANSTGDYSTFAAVSLNDLGEAAFFAFLDSSGHGIFAGPDPVADKVIASGDSLFGGTVTGLAFDQEGLNNSGQVAFRYVLDNGVNGIAIATPVPEPRALGLLGIALGAVALVRSRVAGWSPRHGR